MLEHQINELARKGNVSDVHITEGMAIWYRDSGTLKRLNDEVSQEHIIDFLRAHADDTGIPVEKLNELLSKNSGDLDFSTATKGVRWRGNVYRTDNKKLALALRKLENKIPDLNKLGLPDAYLALPKRAKGLLLVTGPTGSGKTTTMAATIAYMNQTTRRHIITLEDPVEFVHKSEHCLIHQRQIGRDSKGFAGGLRAALREDPDVIFVGEMRDRDTVQVAIDAANTGHLVLATLHTMNSRQTIERITSFFNADEKEWAQQVLSGVLVGVLSQVLVPRAHGQGGRTLGYELLVNSNSVRNAIREGKTNQIFNAMDTGRSEGQVLMNQCLADKVSAGEISMEDALYFSYDPKGLEKELSRG